MGGEAAQVGSSWLRGLSRLVLAAAVAFGVASLLGYAWAQGPALWIWVLAAFFLALRAKAAENAGQKLADALKEQKKQYKVAKMRGEKMLNIRKMSAVTSLGAGVAHEINNPLTSVLGLSQLLRQRMQKRGEEGPYATVLMDIENEARRIMKIVRSFLNMAQNYHGTSFAKVDLHAVLNEACVAMGQQQTAKKAVVKQAFDAPAAEVFGNAMQLRKVFENLLSNAQEATGDAGVISLRTKAEGDDYVRVEVEDNGPGVAKAHLDKIFEPFFSGRRAQGQEGLGLTEAFCLIEEHHGMLEASSELGLGTCVSVVLPLARPGSDLA